MHHVARSLETPLVAEAPAAEVDSHPHAVPLAHEQVHVVVARTHRAELVGRELLSHGLGRLTETERVLTAVARLRGGS